MSENDKNTGTSPEEQLKKALEVVLTQLQRVQDQIRTLIAKK